MRRRVAARACVRALPPQAPLRRALRRRSFQEGKRRLRAPGRRPRAHYACPVRRFVSPSRGSRCTRWRRRVRGRIAGYWCAAGGRVRGADSQGRRVNCIRLPGTANPRIPITISLGVAELNDTHATTGDLFAAADCSLYAAKRLGRNRVEAASGVVRLMLLCHCRERSTTPVAARVSPRASSEASCARGHSGRRCRGSRRRAARSRRRSRDAGELDDGVLGEIDHDLPRGFVDARRDELDQHRAGRPRSDEDSRERMIVRSIGSSPVERESS